MKDRVPMPGQEGRVKITPESGGAAYYAKLEMADNPTQAGDEPIKANLLPDDVASALGLTGNPQVKDALNLLSGAALRKTVNGVNILTDMSGNDFPLQYVKLMDITTTADAAQVNLDVSGIDFTKYAMVQLFGTAAGTTASPSESSNYIFMRVNNGGGFVSTSQYNASNTSQNYVAMYQRWPTNNAKSTVTIRADISGFSAHPYENYEYIKGGMLFIRSLGACNANISSYYCSKTLSSGEQLSTINFLTDNASGKIVAGSRFIIYGVKL